MSIWGDATLVANGPDFANGPDPRPDRRCGSQYPLDDGRPGQCDPSGNGPCCSKTGWCGVSDLHCKCSGCTDFRQYGKYMPVTTCSVHNNLLPCNPLFIFVMILMALACVNLKLVKNPIHRGVSGGGQCEALLFLSLKMLTCFYIFPQFAP